MKTLLPQIIFFQVKEPALKLTTLCQVALTHFQNKDPLIFLVQDKASLEFIDNLLWHYPEASFLPHLSTNEPTSEIVIITQEEKNLNQASSLFNLCTGVPQNLEGIKKIYELEDSSTLEKQEIVKKRYQFYREQGFPIAYGNTL